jgi:hypothetical protein
VVRAVELDISPESVARFLQAHCQVNSVGASVVDVTIVIGRPGTSAVSGRGTGPTDANVASWPAPPTAAMFMGTCSVAQARAAHAVAVADRPFG